MEWIFSPTAFMHGSRPSKVAHHFEKKTTKHFSYHTTFFCESKSQRKSKQSKSFGIFSKKQCKAKMKIKIEIKNTYIPNPSNWVKSRFWTQIQSWNILVQIMNLTVTLECYRFRFWTSLLFGMFLGSESELSVFFGFFKFQNLNLIHIHVLWPNIYYA